MTPDPLEIAPALPFLAELERLTLREWIAVGVACEPALLTPEFRPARTRLRERVRAQLGGDGRDALVERVRRITGPVAEQVRLACPAVPELALQVLEYGALVGAGVWLVRELLTPDDQRALYAPWA